MFSTIFWVIGTIPRAQRNRRLAACCALACLAAFASSGVSAAPLDVVVVGVTPSYDQPYVDFVTSAALRPVVVEYIASAYTATNGTDDLSTTMVTRLNAADLIILSRQIPAGNVDDGGGTERDKWNGLTKPLLQASDFAARGNAAAASNWGWINSTTIPDNTTTFTTLQVTAPADPIFAGITLGAGNTLQIFDTQSNRLRTIQNDMAGNNGTLLATRLGEATAPILVRWTNTTLPFFTGGPAVGPAAKRILFNFQDDARNQISAGPPIVYANQIAGLNANGKKLFQNVLYDLLPTLGQVPPPNSTSDWTTFQ